MSSQVGPVAFGAGFRPARRRAGLWALWLAGAIAAAALPALGNAFHVDLACQVLLASVGAMSLMLLTGFAGQVSLGHAGLIAAGAFTAGILHKELGAPIWITVPAAGLAGGALGLVFGLPSLRLRGLYLAVSTLALYFIVIYLGGEYETKRGCSTGITVEPPAMLGWTIESGRAWYVVLLAAAGGTYLVCSNILRLRTGRAWGAIRSNETVAEAIGISVARAKLSAFVISSVITAMAGALFAYYRGFVSIEAFSLYLSIQYVAMVIIGGIGSLAGALLGALFVTLFPYAIEGSLRFLVGSGSSAGSAFAAIYAAFGLVMILFLAFEPAGLVGIVRRVARAARRIAPRRAMP